MSSIKSEHSTTKSWETFKRYLKSVSTGSSTMSKRPQYEPEEPCYIERGKGCRVWDIDGNEYIDFRNALGPVLLGYCYPEIDDAVREQLEKGMVFGHPTILEGEVAELLVELIPCAEKVRYLKTGGEAVAASIKVARSATGRDIIVQCGYNGWLNALAAGGTVLPRVRQDVPRGVPLDIARLHRSLPWGDITEYENIFNEYGDQVAAVVVAMDYARPEEAIAFMAALRDLTNKHGTLLISDEIVTGFRIAPGGLHEYAGVKVDLAVYSKGIANGMPLSAVVGKDYLMNEYNESPVSSTFSGEALSLAAAKACLQIYHHEDVVGHLNEMGALLQDGMNHLFDRHDYPLQSIGLPSCPLLVERSDPTRAADSKQLEMFLRAAYRNGVSLYLVNYPNYSCKQSDITEALTRLNSALEEIENIQQG